MKKQNGQNGTKRPTGRAPTNNYRANGGANRRANQGKLRANVVDALSVAQAARSLAVDASTIKRMCTSGKLDCFKTSGSHWRIHLAGIEAIRRGDTDTKIGRSSVSSPTLQYRRETLEETRLLIEEKKARSALEELEGQECQRRKLEENEARREQREHEAEQARQDREREERAQQEIEARKKQQEFEQWQQWADPWIQYALSLVSSSPDVRDRFAGEIQKSVEQALEELGPLGPRRARVILEQLVTAAARRAIEPWRRQQEVEVAVKQGIQQLSFLAPTEWMIRAESAAREAIANLAPNASLAEVQAATRAAGQRVAQEYRRGEEQKRVEHQADEYLWNLSPYLTQLQADPKGYDFKGKIVEDAQRIKNSIRPKLIAEASALDSISGPRRVRELAKEWLDADESQ